jgi:hypothetical protein
MSHKVSPSKSYKLPKNRNNEYEESFIEQLKAAKEGSNYKLLPGLHDRRIWEAGIETSEQKNERKKPIRAR